MNHQIKKLGVFRSISLWHARGTYYKSLSGSKNPIKYLCVCVSDSTGPAPTALLPGLPLFWDLMGIPYDHKVKRKKHNMPTPALRGQPLRENPRNPRKQYLEIFPKTELRTRHLVVHVVWKERWPVIWVYSGSRAVANRLASWSRTWKEVEYLEDSIHLLKRMLS